MDANDLCVIQTLADSDEVGFKVSRTQNPDPALHVDFAPVQPAHKTQRV